MAKDEMKITRRGLIKSGAAAAGFAALGPSWHPSLGGAPSEDRFRGLRVGITSYSVRRLSLDDAIKATRRLGLSYISLKDFHLPMKSTADQRREVADKVRQAGLKLMGCGVVYMKNDQQEIRNAFEYARDAGIPTIVASPDPQAMPIVDRMVKEFDIRVAIHNHGPEDKNYPTPESVAKAIGGYDSRIGFCIDIDHTTRAGLDPAREIRRYASRLYEMHYRDIDKAASGGKTIEAGRGVIDLVSVFKALLDIRFEYHVALEYEKDEYDPLPGMAESIGYTRGILAVMR